MRTHTLMVVGLAGLALGSALVALLSGRRSPVNEFTVRARDGGSTEEALEEAFSTDFLSELDTAPDMQILERFQREAVEVEPYDALDADNLAAEWLTRATEGRRYHSPSETPTFSDWVEDIEIAAENPASTQRQS